MTKPQTKPTPKLIFRDNPSTGYFKLKCADVQKAKKDGGLSPEALGVHVYLLSHGETWNASNAALRKRFGIGREKLARILKELKDHHLVKRRRVRQDDGRWEWLTSADASPRSGNPAMVPRPGLPEAAEPETANPAIRKERVEKRESSEMRAHHLLHFGVDVGCLLGEFLQDEARSFAVPGRWGYSRSAFVMNSRSSRRLRS